MPLPSRSPTRVEASELPRVLQFMQLLWALVHALEKTSKRMSIDVGVTGPQRLVLRVVELFPGVSAGHVAAVLHLHPSTLTGILRRLIERGWLVREADAEDRRRSVLRLSRRGTRINTAARGTVEAAVKSALNRVSERDLAATRRVLESIERRLESATSASPRRLRHARGRSPQRSRRIAETV
jgi:DNA-binding MarR family transcriptional regulator